MLDDDDELTGLMFEFSAVGKLKAKNSLV